MYLKIHRSVWSTVNSKQLFQKHDNFFKVSVVKRCFVQDINSVWYLNLTYVVLTQGSDQHWDQFILPLTFYTTLPFPISIRSMYEQRKCPYIHHGHRTFCFRNELKHIFTRCDTLRWFRHLFNSVDCHPLQTLLIPIPIAVFLSHGLPWW